jgi:hypothetical protein
MYAPIDEDPCLRAVPQFETPALGGKRTSGYWSRWKCGAHILCCLNSVRVGLSYSEELAMEAL